jgi:hypothetical protein
MRIGAQTLSALVMLDRCPFLPADAVAALLDLHSRAAYQLLARLARAGLAQTVSVELGHVLGGRRIGLWSLTNRGRQRVADETGDAVMARGRRARQRARHRPTDLPLLVSTYRLLSALVAEHAEAEPVQVLAWEYRWRRTWRPVAAGRRTLAVELPGAADLALSSARPRWTVLLLPDLGTAPVGGYRGLVRRLLALRTALSEPRTAEPVLTIATPDPDGHGGRAAAWRRLLAEVAALEQERPLQSRVLTWDQVAALGGREHAVGPVASSTQHLLDLVGRHPCLSLGQLATLLGTSRRRAARLRDELVARDWLRLIPATDIPPSALAQVHEEPQGLGLAELTPLGRRVLAGWLGLSGPTAARHHGLSGGQDWAGRRRRLLRNLAHTLGTNDVFVALAAAARQAADRGQHEELEEWRSAAACERRLCKPDGYGRYRRGQVKLSFFLEYDRATERAASYAAKFDAYYRYRASPQAARDYAGFPSVLVVTTSETAEHRIAEAAARAWVRHGGPPLGVQITRIDLIASQRDGLLGPIWRCPYQRTERAGLWALGPGAGREAARRSDGCFATDGESAGRAACLEAKA